MINGLFVRQVGQQYLIYTPQGIQVGYVFLGQDGQYAKDVVVLNAVTKALAKRWGLSDKKNYPFEISPPSERRYRVLLKPRKPLKIRQFIHAKAL